VFPTTTSRNCAAGYSRSRRRGAPKHGLGSRRACCWRATVFYFPTRCRENRIFQDGAFARECCAGLKVEAGCAADLSDIPNVSQRGNRLGNWLTREQAKELDAGTRSLDTEEEAGLRNPRFTCRLALRGEDTKQNFKHAKPVLKVLFVRWARLPLSCCLDLCMIKDIIMHQISMSALTCSQQLILTLPPLGWTVSGPRQDSGVGSFNPG
jgi:hypothetical protein